MRIANPIYDAVFKYLMEDAEIARGLLSKIIGEDIVEIAVQPQEYVGRSNKFEVIIFRLDFKATIKTKTGKRKKVLIELQKGKNAADIMRFRRYPGDNYRKEDFVEAENKRVALPIITIYFLGFRLKNITTAVMKVSREYTDLITDKPIIVEEEFVEKLTHDSYIIQIQRLKKKVRNDIERVLKVFNQAYATEGDKKMLEFSENDYADNGLLARMVSRLRKAATEEEILRQIEIEEEVDNTIEQHIREKQELAEKLDELAAENAALKRRLETLENQLDEEE